MTFLLSVHGIEAERLNHSQRGISLIAVCFFIMATGIFFTAGAKLYSLYDDYSASATTRDNTRLVQDAMQRYLAENGRYPCPASLTDPIDSPSFGREISADCDGAGAVAGTFVAAGANAGADVRTGAVPVRTLGLEDESMFDGDRRRLVYVVTETHATQGTVAPDGSGEISIVDVNGNPVTSEPVSQIVLSTGIDDNGAYTINGVNIAACNAGAVSGENCDFAANAVYLSTLSRSTNTAGGNMFVHSVSYAPPKPLVQCVDGSTGDDGKVMNTAFLIDTSGSMNAAGVCPAHMPGCTRMDVAQWAMRRVMPATIYNSSLMGTAGDILMTGFVARNSASSVRGQFSANDPEFYNPTDLDQDSDGDGTANRDDMDDYLTSVGVTLETDMAGMCPSGNTPLGIHIDALASQVGDGTPTRPNKIIVISDGVSNNGEDPVSVAARLAATHPNLQVDIVDVAGNPSLRAISDQTGGKYYNSGDPDELLNDLLTAAGLCNTYIPPAATDKPSCGSSASGWSTAGGP